MLLMMSESPDGEKNKKSQLIKIKVPQTVQVDIMRVNITKGAFMYWPESTGSSTKCPEWLLSSEPLVLNWTTLMGRSNRHKNSQRKVAGGGKYICRKF